MTIGPGLASEPARLSPPATTAVNRLGMNVAANIGGIGALTLAQFVCVPFYLEFLGIEGYGIVAFFMMLQASLRILDLGLSPALNRELARYSAQPVCGTEIRDLVRTLELSYWVLGLAIGAILFGAAGLISTRWLQAGTLTPATVQQAVMLMGGVIATQWPLSLYQAGLMGMQRQVLLNGIRVVAAIVSGGGSILILWLVSPTLSAFFAWQLAAGFVEVMLVALALWRSLPSAARPARVHLAPVHKILRFAGGMSGIALGGVILTQMDKILLSKLMPLEDFGYYTLAALIAGGLQLFIIPVYGAIFPRLCAHVASGDAEAIRRVYHGATQLMAVLVFPPALILIFFAAEILELWTGDAALARAAAPIVPFMVAGTAINGVMFLPYALQLAYGWTRLTLTITLVMCFAMVPAVYYMALRFGAPGAASVWLMLNLLNLALALPLMHRRLLRREAWEWISRDVGPPLLIASAITFIAHQLLALPPARLGAIGVLIALFTLTSLLTIVSSPQVRGSLWSRLQGMQVPGRGGLV